MKLFIKKYLEYPDDPNETAYAVFLTHEGETYHVVSYLRYVSVRWYIKDAQRFSARTLIARGQKVTLNSEGFLTVEDHPRFFKWAK